MDMQRQYHFVGSDKLVVLRLTRCPICVIVIVIDFS